MEDNPARTTAQEAPTVPRPGRPPAFRRNFALGILNGVFFNTAGSFVSSNLVLPGLVRLLQGSNILVSALSALEQGGWLLPQLLVGTRIQDRPRKLPIYQVSAVARGVLFGAMVLLIALAGQISHVATLGAFLLLYGLYNLGAGWAAVPFQEVVAKTIPPRWRGRYFGLRQMGGGLVTLFLVSPVVGLVLGAGSPWPFPQNYTLLFGLASIGVVVGLITFSMVAEPPSAEVRKSGPLVAQLRLLPALWRGSRDLRLFLAHKVLSRLAAVALPFYILYAQESLQVPKEMTGDYMAIISGVVLLSNLLWSYLSDRRGNRRLLRLGAGLFAAAPALALFLPWLGGLLGLSTRANAYLFGLVFVLSGMGDTCLGIGVGNYILELLPERDRPAGLGLVNTVAGVASLLAIPGGGLPDLVGYPALFLLASILGLASFVLAWPLMEPRRDPGKPY
jgi:MFS family permease